MTSAPLAWMPREGRILCVIDLDLAPDIDFSPYPLDEVLRMCADFSCAGPSDTPFDFEACRKRVAESERQREKAESKPSCPVVEVIPPTTLFTEAKRPSVRINLGLPPELAVEFRNKFEQNWQELMADIRQCGLGPFLDLYRHPNIFGHPPAKAEYPVSRWRSLFITFHLICVKNPQRRVDS